MVFRHLRVNTTEGPVGGFFLSRGLFFILLFLACGFGVILTALFRGLYPPPPPLTAPASLPTEFHARFSPGSSPPHIPPAREVPTQLTQQLTSALAQRKFEEVLSDASSLTVSFPGSRIPFLYRIQALVQLGRHSEADSAIREALKAFPEDPEILIIGASFFQAIRNPLAAEKMLLKALSVDPHRLGALRGLATTYVRAGLWRLAKEVATNALRKFPADPILVLELADASRLLSEFPEAIVRYQEYLRLVPHAPADVRFSLGQSLRLSGSSLDLIKDQFRQALQIQASHVPTLNDYSLVLASASQHEEAVKLLPALLEHSHQAPFALDTAGLVYLMAKNLKEAEPLLIKAQKGEPGNPIIAAHLSAFYYHLGVQEKAEGWLKQAEAGCRGDQVLLKRVMNELDAYRP